MELFVNLSELTAIHSSITKFQRDWYRGVPRLSECGESLISGREKQLGTPSASQSTVPTFVASSSRPSSASDSPRLLTQNSGAVESQQFATASTKSSRYQPAAYCVQQSVQVTLKLLLFLIQLKSSCRRKNVLWWKRNPQFKTVNCEISRKKKYASIEKLEQQKKEYWYRSKNSLHKSQNAKIKKSINLFPIAILM